MAEFKDRLKELREEQRLTQTQVALKSNISRRTICRYESGNSIPYNERAVKLAQAFNVTVKYILGSSDLKECTAYACHENCFYNNLEKGRING